MNTCDARTFGHGQVVRADSGRQRAALASAVEGMRTWLELVLAQRTVWVVWHRRLLSDCGGECQH